MLFAACIPALVSAPSRGISQTSHAMMTTKRLAAARGKTMKETSPYTSNLRIISKFSSRDFTPDGNLAKGVWRRAHWMHFDHGAWVSQNYPQSETEVASVWTTTSVYLAYRCKYTTLNVFKGEDPAVEKWGLWDRDVVEAFINPIPERVNHYYEFEVAPNNQWVDLKINKDKTPMVADANWNSHFEHATHIDSAHHIWTCEIRIPVASLGVKSISAGSQWRLNLFHIDGGGNGTQRHFLSWSTTGSPGFHVPTRFGIVDFAR